MKDAIGNEIHVGDKVLLTGCGPNAIGHISHVKAGGIITGLKRGGSEMEPGILTVTVEAQISFDPRNPIFGQIIKVVMPAEEEEPKVADA